MLLSDINTSSRWSKKYTKLTKALGRIVEDNALIQFYPLNIKDEKNVADIFLYVSNIIQQGEDEEVKAKDLDLFPNEEDSFG